MSAATGAMRGSGILLGLLLLGGCAVMASALPAMETMGGGPVPPLVSSRADRVPTAVALPPVPQADIHPRNVPAPGALSQHALEKHGEDAEYIKQRADRRDYMCAQIYAAPLRNRVLWLFFYKDTSLVGGFITTASGTCVSAWLSDVSYWYHVVARDGYRYVCSIAGNCPPIGP